MNPFKKLIWVFYYSNRKITNTSLKAIFLSVHLEEKNSQKNLNFTKKLGLILTLLFDLLLYVLSKYILITSSTFFFLQNISLVTVKLDGILEEVVN